MNEKDLLKQFNAPEGSEFVMQFKNGNIKIKRKVVCDRCNNKNGIYYIGVHNGNLVPSHVDNGVCFKCLGSGWAYETEVLMTPENQAKHDAKAERDRQKRIEQAKAYEAERLAEEQRKEAERLAEEERIKAQKAISQFVGSVGDKLDVELKYIGSPHFEVPSFRGYGTEMMFIHTFLDGNGNKLVWKTSKGLPEGIESDMMVKVKGTIKDHSEYADEKQTVLTRCKVSKEG